jgi:hypothetical protein
MLVILSLCVQHLASYVGMELRQSGSNDLSGARIAIARNRESPSQLLGDDGLRGIGVRNGHGFRCAGIVAHHVNDAKVSEFWHREPSEVSERLTHVEHRRQHAACLGQEIPPIRFLLLCGRVTKTQNDAGERPLIVANGRGTVVDDHLASAANEKNRVIRTTGHNSIAKHYLSRTLDFSSGAFVDDPKYLAERPTERLFDTPTRERLRNRVHEGHAQDRVGRDDCVADAFERCRQ